MRAFGGGGAFGLGVIRRDGPVPSSTGVFDADRGTLNSRGVAAVSSPVFSSSSSSPKESLLLASGFFFFFLGGPSLRGELLLAISRRKAHGLKGFLRLPVSHIASGRSGASGITRCESPQGLVMGLALFLLEHLCAPFAKVGEVDETDGLRFEEVLRGGRLARERPRRGALAGLF